MKLLSGKCTSPARNTVFKILDGEDDSSFFFFLVYFTRQGKSEDMERLKSIMLLVSLSLTWILYL